MKINFMSDLHLEFEPLVLTNDAKADVLVLAGDIGVGSLPMLTYQPFLEHAASLYKKVIYVLGNHEYYHGHIDKTLDSIIENTNHISNLHILEDEFIDIDGVRFLGCTLWTNFGNQNLRSMSHAAKHMNDYHIIKKTTPSGAVIKLTPDVSYNKHINSMKFLNSNMTDNSVVVTHMAPSVISIHKKYFHEKALNVAYYSDLENFIIRHQPMLWVHGHVHNSNQYRIGDTTVCSNPRGYYGDNYEFNQDIVYCTDQKKFLTN